MASRPSFDDIYMSLAFSLSERSHCIKKKVGAVITKDTRVITSGYNGPPEGTFNCDEEWPEQGCLRSARGGCLFSFHAEQNAILYALKHHVDLNQTTLYVTLAPCADCARLILSAQIKKVVYQDSYASFKGLDKEEGIIFLEAFGVQVKCHKKEG